MRGAQWLLSARDEVLMSEISRLRRRRMLHITEGEDNFFLLVRPVNVFIPLRWVREGLFRFTFELHRSSRSGTAQ